MARKKKMEGIELGVMTDKGTRLYLQEPIRENDRLGWVFDKIIDEHNNTYTFRELFLDGLQDSYHSSIIVRRSPVFRTEGIYEGIKSLYKMAYGYQYMREKGMIPEDIIGLDMEVYDTVIVKTDECIETLARKIYDTLKELEEERKKIKKKIKSS